MATIIPHEFNQKSKSELVENIESLARYVHNLKNELEDQLAETRLSKARETKLRGDILQLKSMIGQQNLHIGDLVEKIQQLDNIEDITYEEANPN